MEAFTHRSIVAVLTSNYRNNDGTTVDMATERQVARILSVSVIKVTMKV